ncbi:MAG: hypothetical protein Q8Q52_04710 [Acidimicrobiia bacterium]|nr:hypothetical protein [Acidimicrobiia bacterium]
MKDDTAARIRSLVAAARRQKLIVGGSRGTTGPLGELYACQELQLNRAVDGMRGYDATDAEGRRVQIKSRAPERGDHVNPIGTVGRITNWDFDYALLVLLDAEFRRDAIWRAEESALAELQARVRNPARGIPVREFMRVAHRVDVRRRSRAAMPILDPETGKEYRSKYKAGKALCGLVGGDINNTLVWYQVLRAFPNRFQTKNPAGEWVALDDPSAPLGTTIPGS